MSNLTWKPRRADNFNTERGSHLVALVLLFIILPL